MFQRIVVPLDGSKRAERAIPIAARLARPARGTLILTRVVLPPLDCGKGANRHSTMWERNIYERERAEAASYLAHALLTQGSALVGVDSEIGVATGLIPPAICSVAQAEQADLIVICSRGETGFKRRFFGSVAQEVVRRSAVPVLVLSERGKALPTSYAARPARAVVALDGSSLAESALEPAARMIATLAGSSQGILHLVRVVEPLANKGKWGSYLPGNVSKQIQARQEAETYLRNVVERFQQGQLAELRLVVTFSVVSSSDIVQTIIQQAECGEWNGQVGECALIALALPECAGSRRRSLGRVTRQALEATQLPILLVRPQPTPVQKREKIG
jgi:nucleotide-binding universal stress UspA family protein